MLGYTCQLYFDFAGYSNMAIGLGLMLGFAFPQNFDSPYKSRNISEFWRRWHITLSSWLRDYLFVPLGGSRYGRWLTLRNLLLVMFLGGLWHGAGWTFVLWGLYHGLLLVVHSLCKDRVRLPHVAGVLLDLPGRCVWLGAIPSYGHVHVPGVIASDGRPAGCETELLAAVRWTEGLSHCSRLVVHRVLLRPISGSGGCAGVRALAVVLAVVLVTLRVATR